MLLEWTGIIELERIEGVPNQLIIKWNRNYAKSLSELITKAIVARERSNTRDG